MGRPERRERERKRAAASCQRLDKFLPSKSQRVDNASDTLSQSQQPSQASETRNESGSGGKFAYDFCYVFEQKVITFGYG